MTRGEGGLTLVRVAGATLLSSEEVVSSELIYLSVMSLSRISS